ncbi:head completion protein [Acinetobacter phage SH-Ab 15599]|nr:head completion protein [Acinetobacter phage SH-Ab 15599]
MAWGKFQQGKYGILHPEKYIGDHTNCVFRSSWERILMKWFDETPEILRWQSEEKEIPYWDPTSSKMRRYIIDFVFWSNTKDGLTKFLVEVKPKHETQPPKRGPKESEFTWQEKVKTWTINSAKWAAAKKVAEAEKAVFIILTEDHIMPNRNAIKPYRQPKKPKVKVNGNVSSRKN